MIVNEVGVRERVQFETCQQQVGVFPKYCNQCKSKLNKVFFNTLMVQRFNYIYL